MNNSKRSMMPAGYHSDSDSTLLPLPKSAITWFGGIFARLPPLAAGLLGNDRTTNRVQVCENNWVRKIAGVKRADRRRMVELREEAGVQRSLTERLARSRLQWAGHVERMADDRLPKRAAELREQGRRRRGRPRLRWEYCVKRYVRKAGEEEDWKKKTRDRGG